MESGNGTNGTGTGPALAGPLTVKEAAAYLGIGERAVRKRIHAGTLMAQHIDGIWRVWPDAQPQRGTNGTTEQGRSTMEPRNRAAEQGPALPAATAIMEGIVAPIAAELAEARQTIERLARENGALTERLSALEKAESERDTLRMRVRALETTAAATVPLDAPDGPKMHESLSAVAGQGSDAGDLWATIAAKAAAIPEAVTQAYEVLEAAQPEDPPRRGLLARLLRPRR